MSRTVGGFSINAKEQMKVTATGLGLRALSTMLLLLFLNTERSGNDVSQMITITTYSIQE